MITGSLIFSFAALIVSITSLIFSRASWRESNRPIVTVRVTTHSGGNVGTALNLLVENTGNRPAKNVRLLVNPEALKAALVLNEHEQMKRQIENCFSDGGVIPVLANGKSVSNSFGFLNKYSEQKGWIEHSRFDVMVTYEDLGGRKFSHTVPLFLADDKGFAGGFWSNDKDN